MTSSLVVITSSTPSFFDSYSALFSAPLINAIKPVRLQLHALLTEEEAARLLCVSRSFTHCLLRSFVFRRHAFIASNDREVRRVLRLHESFDLQVTRLMLSSDSAISAALDWSHQLLLAPSLISLALGPVESSGNQPHPQSIFCDSAPDRLLPSSIRPWREVTCESDEQRAERLCRDMQAEYGCGWKRYRILRLAGEGIRYTVPSDQLPHGLRVLQLCLSSDSPQLAAHCFPSTVQVLDLGYGYNHPLSPDILPPALVHLMLGEVWDHPITPGLLPLSLECLCLGTCFNHPLAVSSLPSALRVLELGNRFDQSLPAGVLPDSLVCLILSSWSSECILPPRLISLHLDDSDSCRQPLPPRWLPPALRELHLGDYCTHPLPLGALPAGLQLLRISGRYHNPPLDLRGLPGSLVALDLSSLPASCIGSAVLPSGLRSLRLNRSFQSRMGRLTAP